jgi:RimJ/RimL family protein N-acetyltransferase
VPIVGKSVRLRELTRADYPLLVFLRNDLDTQGWSRTLPPDFTLGMYKKRFDERPFDYRRDWAIFMIEPDAGGAAIGYITYVDTTDRFDTIIGISTARPHWGSGGAHEASELLLRFLFEELGMRVVRLWTQSGNSRAVAEKLGFREAIRVREAIWKAGSYHDNLGMDLLRGEWFALHPELTDRLLDPFVAAQP